MHGFVVIFGVKSNAEQAEPPNTPTTQSHHCPHSGLKEPWDAWGHPNLEEVAFLLLFFYHPCHFLISVGCEQGLQILGDQPEEAPGSLL